MLRVLSFLLKLWPKLADSVSGFAQPLTTHLQIEIFTGHS